MVEEGFFIRAKREETGVEYAELTHFVVGLSPKSGCKVLRRKIFVIVPYRESSETVNIEIQ